MLNEWSDRVPERPHRLAGQLRFLLGGLVALILLAIVIGICSALL